MRGQHAASHAFLYSSWKQSINSPGQQVGESSFPMSFSADVADVTASGREREHTCSASSSSVLKAGGLDHTSSIIGGQKALVLFLG